jgi:hypothetical protein
LIARPGIHKPTSALRSAARREEQMSDKLRLWFVLVLTVTGAIAIVAGMSGQVTTKAASLATSEDR